MQCKTWISECSESSAYAFCSLLDESLTLSLVSAKTDLHLLFHRTLADMNGDGKMDKLEFSVAMHLIKKKLQGYELPKVLPASLKVAPSPVIGSFGMQAGPMAMGQPVVMGIAPAMNPPMGKLMLELCLVGHLGSEVCEQ